MSAQWGHGYYTGKKEAAKKGYVGLYFHTFDNAGMILRQGYIEKKISAVKYLVKWLSWLDGIGNNTEIIKLPNDALFYVTIEDLKKGFVRLFREKRVLWDNEETRDKQADYIEHINRLPL